MQDYVSSVEAKRTTGSDRRGSLPTGSGSLTISMWQVSISMRSAPPSATLALIFIETARCTPSGIHVRGWQIVSEYRCG